MTRQTYVSIDTHALLHNLKRVRSLAPGKRVIAMVKANAYGCGLEVVVPVFDAHVDGFGVACLEEALVIRALGGQSDCVLFEGVFSPEEYLQVAAQQFQCVIHHPIQLEWLLGSALPQPIKLWIKVDTGMHRLGLLPEDMNEVINALKNCPWVHEDLVVMSHFANADDEGNPANAAQLDCFHALHFSHDRIRKSLANSAAIITLPEAHVDFVRPGIMLYGASPFVGKTAKQLGLKPVMHFKSMIHAIHHYPPGTRVGYGGIWQASRPSSIGVVAVGYGDGYPRSVAPNTLVSVQSECVPLVGRVSMDMLTVDLTDCTKTVSIGDEVELWGDSIPIELVASSAGTIAYELMCQLTARVYRKL